MVRAVPTRAPKRVPPRGARAIRKSRKRQVAAVVGGGGGASSSGESESEGELGAVVFRDEAEAVREAEATRDAAAARRRQPSSTKPTQEPAVGRESLRPGRGRGRLSYARMHEGDGEDGEDGEGGEGGEEGESGEGEGEEGEEGESGRGEEVHGGDGDGGASSSWVEWQAEVAWVQCEACDKWRRLPAYHGPVLCSCSHLSVHTGP